MPKIYYPDNFKIEVVKYYKMHRNIGATLEKYGIARSTLFKWNTAHTLELRVDSHGLFGSITINPKDQDAMNLYARVQRGDVDQCSFGFDILSEDYDVRDDGSVHWTIKKVKLYEVSVCTFPAYEETNVQARSAERDEIKRKALEAWKLRTLAKLKGEK